MPKKASYADSGSISKKNRSGQVKIYKGRRSGIVSLMMVVCYYCNRNKKHTASKSRAHFMLLLNFCLFSLKILVHNQSIPYTRKLRNINCKCENYVLLSNSRAHSSTAEDLCTVNHSDAGPKHCKVRGYTRAGTQVFTIVISKLLPFQRISVMYNMSKYNNEKLYIVKIVCNKYTSASNSRAHISTVRNLCTVKTAGAARIQGEVMVYIREDMYADVLSVFKCTSSVILARNPSVFLFFVVLLYILTALRYWHYCSRLCNDMYSTRFTDYYSRKGRFKQFLILEDGGFLVSAFLNWELFKINGTA